MHHLNRFAVGAGIITAFTQVPTTTPSQAILGAGVLMALLGGISWADEGTPRASRRR